MPLFAAFLRYEYYGAAGRDDLDAPIPGTSDYEAHSKCIDASTLTPPLSRKGGLNYATTKKLLSWLHLFETFKNPNAAFCADVLKKVFMSMLVKTEPKFPYLRSVLGRCQGAKRSCLQGYVA